MFDLKKKKKRKEKIFVFHKQLKVFLSLRGIQQLLDCLKAESCCMQAILGGTKSCEGSGWLRQGLVRRNRQYWMGESAPLEIDT